MARIVVDPITRIEGHLRIEAQVDGGAVRDAWSSSTMWRGIESILTGRDPRDAWYFAQRICGVCTTVHALASVRAVEDALGIEPPPNAKLLRGLIAASQFVQDHVVHFYHLHALDWVDVTSALDGDPAKAASVAATLSDYPRSSAGQFKAVRDRLRAFVQGGRLGPFAGGWWGHPAYKLPPEVNLVAVSHYRRFPRRLFGATCCGDHQASSRAVDVLTSTARHGTGGPSKGDRGPIQLLNHIDVICYRSETP